MSYLNLKSRKDSNSTKDDAKETPAYEFYSVKLESGAETHLERKLVKSIHVNADDGPITKIKNDAGLVYGYYGASGKMCLIDIANQLDGGEGVAIDI
jgi:hypothetical protein